MHAEFEVLVSGFQFVEAPRANENGDILFSELHDGGLYRYRPGEGVHSLSDRKWIGGTVLSSGATAVISGEGGLARINLLTGLVEPILTEIDGEPINAINDIEADSRGGIFGGTVDFQSILVDQTTPRPGKFFHLAADGEITILRNDLFASNGLGFSPDGRTLFHSETTKGVWKYELDDRGLPGDQKLITSLDDSDGLVVDASGDIWVACWDQALIAQYAPDGTAKGEITLPFTHVISLDFTGADLCDLIVSVGGTRTGDDDPAGGIIRLRREIPGQRSQLSEI